MLLSKTIRLFLDSIGRRDEYEFYLNKFKSEPGRCFAAVCPDDNCWAQAADLMAFDLEFLRKLELVPLMVLCGPAAETHAHWLQTHASGTMHLQTFDSVGPDLEDAINTSREAGRVLLAAFPNRQRHEVLPALLPGITRRIHLLRLEGNLQSSDGDTIWYHYLQGANRHTLQPEDQPLSELAAACIDVCPSAHLSISSPMNLLMELFTVKGAGTVIRRGSRIQQFDSISEVDSSRLTTLMHQAFAKELLTETLYERVESFYIEEAYRGAVLLEPHPAGRYLSKFAVGTEARGEGLAQELWDLACAPQPALFWRSRDRNPVNQWYRKHADGRHRSGDWQIFWRGIDPVHLPEIIAYCLERPSDFSD